MSNANELGKKRRILVVEDNWMIASEVSTQFEKAGCEIVGPFKSLDPAQDAVRSNPPDAALLDIHLGSEKSYPIADMLRERRVPFAFATGFDSKALPTDYRAVPRFSKPFRPDLVARFFEILDLTASEN